MNASKKKEDDDLRMSSAEFDRIMGHALQVKPEEAKKLKRRKNLTQKTSKKKSAR
jgi:hypothetical protein